MIGSTDECQEKYNASSSSRENGPRVRKGRQKKDNSTKNDSGESIKGKSKKKGKIRNAEVAGEENHAVE